MEKIYNPDLHTKMQYLENAKNYTKGISQLSYELLQIEQGQNILEFGCGGGYDVFEMANLVGNTGSVYGVDIDEETVEYAQSKNALPNVFFEQNTTPTLRFQDNSFDRIRAERVLQHVPNAEATLQDLVRVLKPHGKIGIIETDWASLTFFSNLKDIERKIVNFILEVVSTNALATRKIGYNLANTHLKIIKNIIYPCVFYTYEEADKFIMLDDTLLRAMELGYLTSDEVNQWKLHVIERENMNFFAMQLNFFVCVAEQSV